MAIITRKKLGERIKTLRESASYSQEELAKKIGITRPATSQIEAGKRDLNALELAKIAKIFAVPLDFLLRNETTTSPKKKSKDIKKFKFNPDKLKNIVLYILNKCGGKPNVGETVLYKLLYFSDFDSFEIIGEPITGMNYVKLQYGPVPQSCEYDLVIKEMAKKNELKIISQNYYGMPQKRYIALADYDINIFKPQELEIIDSAVDRFSDMSAVQIEDCVHGDTPWKESEDKDIINYDLVFCRTPKFSRRNYNWQMQNSVAEDYLKKEAISEKEYNYYENL